MSRRGGMPRNVGKSMNVVHSGNIKSPTMFTRIHTGKKTSNRKHAGSRR